MTPWAEYIAVAFKAACRDELKAPKSGNVHFFAAGHRMTARDFVRSAEAAAEPLAQTQARVGARIAAAVEATFTAVGANTNLGIILLCAPLAAAADPPPSDLRTALSHVLADLDVEDASLAFRAIMRASPAGLGRADRYDVSEPATVTLRQAMAEAADRDRIAHQYASDFDDVFALGVPSLRTALQREAHPRWATLSVYLRFLSAFADSHIVRKHGAAVAEETRRIAASFRERMQALTPDDLLDDLLAWDATLKERGINPGTTADLTVATLFTHRLQNILPPSSNSG